MEVDTSNYTMGEILSIECKNGKQRLVISGVQYEVHIQYQPDIKAKLDIAHFQHNWFSGWSVSNK